MSITLALDGMGGDSAPLVVLSGAEMVLKNHQREIFFRIFGDKEKISFFLKKMPLLAKKCQIIHSDRFVAGDTKIGSALKIARTSSMGMAIKDVLDGNSNAVISAGNTGVYMALSKIFFQTFEGINRPAIPGFIPTVKGKTLVLDLGANTECSPQHLVEFAIMGSTYFENLTQKPRPSIGILNIGSEDTKGNATAQEAARILKESNLNFFGFVEGNNITEGLTDIVVTDGFSGNVALKAIEGTARLFATVLKNEINSSIFGKLGYLLANQAFANIKDRLNPSLYNGAMFLGLKNIAVKSHGGTDDLGFANAILVAIKLVQMNIISNIEKKFLEVN